MFGTIYTSFGGVTNNKRRLKAIGTNDRLNCRMLSSMHAMNDDDDDDQVRFFFM